jgi:transposase
MLRSECRTPSHHWQTFPTRRNRSRAISRQLTSRGCSAKTCACGENVRLREENRTWRARAIQDCQQARYYKRMHERAAERLLEKELQIEAIKSKVAELQHRLFGRKTERGKSKASGAAPLGPKRHRGHQHGAPGHGRKVRENLPVLEVEVLPPAERILCAYCGKPWVLIGEAQVREEIEWEVRVFRRRTRRPKYRRPDGCTCEDGRPGILCAPAPASLIPKGLLGISFVVQALLLKFLSAVPMHRLLGMVRSEGMPLQRGHALRGFPDDHPAFSPTLRWHFCLLAPAGSHSHG